jgi:ribose-phosphate pyrophosphokinase
MTIGVFAFADSREPAGRLARELGAPTHEILVRRFPDGESLVQTPASATTAILYRSLDNPNGKLFELLLAASALRDLGAQRVVLVAPYLAYMRQDRAFEPGEAVSQKVIGRLIADHFDAVLAVDPHLHRTATLSTVVPRIPAYSLSAAAALADAIGVERRPILVGPDAESRQWVTAIAERHGLETLVGTKERRGDRDVTLKIEGIAAVTRRRAVIVDDTVSSGATLIACARLVADAAASSIEAAVTHCLAGPDDLRALSLAGISHLHATDTVAGPHSTIPLAGMIARSLRETGVLGF